MMMDFLLAVVASAYFFGWGVLFGRAMIGSRLAVAEWQLSRRQDNYGWRLYAEARKRAEKLRRGAAEALRRERANTLAAAAAGHASSMIVATSLAGRATAAAERWRDRCRKVRAGASRRIRAMNEQLRAERGAVAAALKDMLEFAREQRGEE